MSEYNKLQIQFCKYCGKECHSINSLLNHERLCKLNPNRQLSPICKKGYNAGKTSWNKGLTKDVDHRVAKISQSVIQTQSKVTDYIVGQASTPEKEMERRNKISTYAKSRNFGGLTLKSGRGKKGWYKGYFCDSTYELVYIIYNIDHNIEFKRCDRFYTYEVDGKIHKYYPDFELSDNSLIEIKGYYTPLVDIKLQSVNDRPIKVLFKEDLKYAFDWVKEKYSYKYLYDLYE